MNSAIERLLTLRVVNVMSRDVIQVSPRQNMADAADLLFEHEISGAPVVDESGRCVGVLSATDFVRERCRRRVRAQGPDREPGVSPGDVLPGQACVGFDAHRVADHMTPILHSISEGSTLVEAARSMCDHHIHRLMVLDDHGHLRGVLSSLDVAAAFISAIEE